MEWKRNIFSLTVNLVSTQRPWEIKLDITIYNWLVNWFKQPNSLPSCSESRFKSLGFGMSQILIVKKLNIIFTSVWNYRPSEPCWSILLCCNDKFFWIINYLSFLIMGRIVLWNIVHIYYLLVILWVDNIILLNYLLGSWFLKVGDDKSYS